MMAVRHVFEPVGRQAQVTSKQAISSGRLQLSRSRSLAALGMTAFRLLPGSENSSSADPVAVWVAAREVSQRGGGARRGSESEREIRRAVEPSGEPIAGAPSGADPDRAEATWAGAPSAQIPTERKRRHKRRPRLSVAGAGKEGIAC